MWICTHPPLIFIFLKNHQNLGNFLFKAVWCASRLFMLIFWRISFYFHKIIKLEGRIISYFKTYHQLSILKLYNNQLSISIINLKTFQMNWWPCKAAATPTRPEHLLDVASKPLWFIVSNISLRFHKMFLSKKVFKVSIVIVENFPHSQLKISILSLVSSIFHLFGF